MLNKLQQYCDLIDNVAMRDDVTRLMNMPVVLEALSKPSRYHNSDEEVPCGLLIHTLRVTKLVRHLLNCYFDIETNEYYYDLMTASALLHDVPYKFSSNGFTNQNHCHQNAIWYYNNSALKDTTICDLILLHNGRFEKTINSDIEKAKLRNYPLSLILHQADLIASRTDIQIDLNLVTK